MNRFLKKVLFLAIPAAGLYLAPVFCPLDSFTFRCWEALKTIHLPLEGPFYPNRHLHKADELGDLVPHTDYAVRKRVEWITDDAGYRARPTADLRYDTVLIGDSFTAGSSLDQADTLAEALFRKTKKPVYPLAPADINVFLEDERFKAHPPRVAVFVLFENNFHFLAPVRPASKVPAKLRGRHPFIREASVLTDHFLKFSLIRRVHFLAWGAFNRLIYSVPGQPHAIQARGRDFFFMRAHLEAVLRPWSAEQTDGIARTLQSYRAALKERGIQLVVLPIPSSLRVCYDDLPEEYQRSEANRFPQLLAASLAKVQITTIDLYAAYASYRGEKTDLYQPDDTHWSPKGVDLAAELLAARLGGLKTVY